MKTTIAPTILALAGLALAGCSGNDVSGELGRIYDRSVGAGFDDVDQVDAPRALRGNWRSDSSTSDGRAYLRVNADGTGSYCLVPEEGDATKVELKVYRDEDDDRRRYGLVTRSGDQYTVGGMSGGRLRLDSYGDVEQFRRGERAEACDDAEIIS